MNKDKIISALFKILVVVGAVLSTVIFVNNESNFLWDLIVKNSANLVKIFAILGYSLFLIATIIEIISKNKYLDLLNVIIAVGSIVFLALLKSIYEDSLDVETSVISVGPSIAIVITYMLVVIFLSLRRTSIGVNLNIRDMVEIAMFCAMAIVLDLTFFKIRIGQNGGSISLVMLPLSFLCVRKGFVKGFIGCGIVFGFLSCLLDGYGLVTYPLDYLGAFGSISIVGLFTTLRFNRFKLVLQEVFLAVFFIVAVAFRLMFSTISGMVLYATPFLGSLSYNAAYILPSAGFVLAALLVLYKPITKLFERKTN